MIFGGLGGASRIGFLETVDNCGGLVYKWLVSVSVLWVRANIRSGCGSVFVVDINSFDGDLGRGTGS